MEPRGRDAVLGALVADAASLGLHWIYDPERIASVAGDRPGFREPDRAAYRKTTAYFAHAGKRAGDSTHYGEQMLVMLRSLAATGWTFDAADYERRFLEAFGPGGTWVGYIDYATRETLRRVDAAEMAALQAARAFDLGGFEKDRALMEAKVLASVSRWRGDKLLQAMEKAVRITHGDNPELIAVGQAMARAVEESRGGSHGSDDVQLPAVVKLPSLVAAGADDAAIEAAVRATNDNDDAVACAHEVTRTLRAAIEGGTVDVGTPPEAGTEDPVAAVGHFGRACPLAESWPAVRWLLARATDFENAVRVNILAGGDSAGRAILLGAVLGAVHGVPADWLDKTACAATAARLCDARPSGG